MGASTKLRLMMSPAKITRIIPICTGIAAFVTLMASGASGQLHASVVQYLGGVDQAPLYTASEQVLPEGYSVAIGTFAEGFDPTAHAGDLPSLLAHWHEYDRTFIRTLAGRAGSFAAQGENTDAFFAGKKIYLLALRTTDGGDALADGSNVVDYAFFGSSHPAWVFPQAGVRPPADLTQIHTGQINESLWGTLAEVDTGEESMPDPDPIIVLGVKQGITQADLSWQNWIDRVFTVDSSPEVKTRTADPAGSGKPNFFHYALNKNPFDRESPLSLSRRASQGEGTPPELTLTYTRVPNVLSGAETFAEYSTDLVHWQPATETIVSTAAETETISASAPMDAGKVFFRIKVRE